MNRLSNNLKVIAVEQADTGIITAFVAQLPGIVVQGKSQEEIRHKIDLLLENFIQKLESSRKNLDIETKILS